MAEKTLANLFQAKDVTDEDLAQAVAAYVKAPADGPREVGSISLDIGAAVRTHPYAAEIMAKADAPEGQRRNAVRTAMLLATVAKAKSPP